MGWASVETGHTWRDGAPANHLYFTGGGGYPLPFAEARLKAAVHLELGASAIVPFGSRKEWAAVSSRPRRSV